MFRPAILEKRVAQCYDYVSGNINERPTLKVLRGSIESVRRDGFVIVNIDILTQALAGGSKRIDFWGGKGCYDNETAICERHRLRKGFTFILIVTESGHLFGSLAQYRLPLALIKSD